RHVGDTRGRTHKRLRVHRGVVQSATPALEPGLLESRCLRTPAGVHPSSINRVSTKPGEAHIATRGGRHTGDVRAGEHGWLQGVNSYVCPPVSAEFAKCRASSAAGAN